MIINTKIISSLLGNVSLYLSVAMSIPLLYSFITVTKGSAEFLISTAVLVSLGILLKYYGKTKNMHMTLKDMFLFTSLVWITALFTSALPFILILKVDFITACYETASAISTSGSTVLGDLSKLPNSILLWRSILQYIGGIGFIAVGIAILPNLNVGGMKLFQTESSEQSSDNVTPKSKTLAKGILLLYVGFTIIAVLTFYSLGMTMFDAVNHAFTSVSTGGMSTHNESMDYFSNSIHWATILFMFVGALPFALMLVAVKGNFSTLYKDAQVRGFFFIIIAITIIVAASLIIQQNYTVVDAIRVSLFNVVNILSSTGYTLEDFSNWNHFITLIFFLIIPLGACSGSTSGGLKVFRLQIAFTLFKRQIHQLMHPSAIFPQRYNNHKVNDTIVRSIIAFFFAYIGVTVFSAILLSASGMEVLDSISTTLACLSNIGPAIGPKYGPCGDFSILNDFQKLVLLIDMILGRLEVLTMIICFMPSFWKV